MLSDRLVDWVDSIGGLKNKFSTFRLNDIHARFMLSLNNR